MVRERSILTHADAVRRALLEHVCDVLRSRRDDFLPRVDVVATTESTLLPEFDLAAGRRKDLGNVTTGAQARSNRRMRDEPAVFAFFLLLPGNAPGLESVG